MKSTSEIVKRYINLICAWTFTFGIAYFSIRFFIDKLIGSFEFVTLIGILSGSVGATNIIKQLLKRKQ